ASSGLKGLLPGRNHPGTSLGGAGGLGARIFSRVELRRPPLLGTDLKEKRRTPSDVPPRVPSPSHPTDPCRPGDGGKADGGRPSLKPPSFNPPRCLLEDIIDTLRLDSCWRTGSGPGLREGG